tara:strand:+ start:6410 stop:6667 length:258 start_codon:yes stop_codon:yes gene_type:complete
MLKEIKYFFFIFVIIFFSFFLIKYYFSDINVKKSNITKNNIETKIDKWSNDIIILEGNTNNIIEYVEKNSTKKKYHFWDLLKFND